MANPDMIRHLTGHFAASIAWPNPTHTLGERTTSMVSYATWAAGTDDIVGALTALPTALASTTGSPLNLEAAIATIDDTTDMMDPTAAAGYDIAIGFVRHPDPTDAIDFFAEAVPHATDPSQTFGTALTAVLTIYALAAHPPKL